MSDEKKYSEDFFQHDKLTPLEKELAPIAGFKVTLKSIFEPYVTEQYPFKKYPTAERFHGKHQLNRYPDGLEKCVGCELCAMACPADAIYVEGAENTVEEQYSPGERYAATWQINYLRCVFCGLCIQACPTRALTMTNEYEMAEDTRGKLIYDKTDLLAPLEKGMLQPPHPMPNNKTEKNYYRGEIRRATVDQIEWVEKNRPEDESINNAKAGNGQGVNNTNVCVEFENDTSLNNSGILSKTSVLGETNISCDLKDKGDACCENVEEKQ